MNLNNKRQLITMSCSHFITHYEEIWCNYKRYGEKILDVDLGKTEDEIRQIIVSSRGELDFFDRINRFWINKYQIYVRTPSDIIRMIELDITGALVEGSEDVDSDSLVIVSKQFWDKLIENSSKDKLACVMVLDSLYVIKLETGKSNRGIEVLGILPTTKIVK